MSPAFLSFQVTKKETVWESETDDEDEAPPQEEPAIKKSSNKAMGRPAQTNTSAKAEVKGKGVG